MKIIYKYQLPNMGKNTLLLPDSAVVLFAGEQGDIITLWCEIDASDKKVQEDTFYVYPTGQSFPGEEMVYMDSVITRKGFVYHIYIGIKGNENTR